MKKYRWEISITRANRLEKIPSGVDAYTAMQPDPPNRFAEYPWDPRNEVLVYETSSLSRLVQLDDVSMRLERVKKSAGRDGT